MPRPRLATLAVVPLLLVSAACGSSSDETSSDSNAGDDTTSSLEGLTVEGEFDTEPTIEVDGLEVSDEQTDITIEGDGPAAVAGEDVLLQITAFNGEDGTKLLSTFDTAPVKASAEQPLFLQNFDEIIDGVTRGSRIVYAAPVEAAVGEEMAPQVGLEAGAPLVVVMDVLSVEPTDVLSAPEGEESEPEAGVPTLVESDGAVTNFDWTGVGGVPDELQVITLIEGDGPAIEPNRLVSFNYFGEVWKAKQPFDESYSRGATVFPVGANSLIEAWDEGLIGVTEGSRVLILSPPEQAYGEQGSPPSIPADATLAFVIDVLGVDG